MKRFAAATAIILILLGQMQLSALAAPSPRPLMVLSDSLIAYWKLEEASGTRLDELSGCGGSGCDLTDNNTVGQAAGKLGNAALFLTANSESLSINDHADLSTGDIDFSIAAWVYLDSKGANRGLVTKQSGTTAATIDYQLIFHNGVDRYRLGVSNGSTITSVDASNYGSPALATWVYIVAWHDAANDTLNIQVNNGTVNSTSYSTGVQDTAASFKMGTTTTSSYHNGRMDAVGFWKKVLTADERTLLWNGGAGCDYPFTACEATPTSTSTSTSAATATDTPTSTNTATATDTATSTSTSTSTSTATDTPTSTDTATSTSTSTATSTPMPSQTFTPSPTGVSPCASGDFTSQPGAAGIDTYISSDAPTTNYGSASVMLVYYSPMRSLLKFDLSAISTDAIVTSAVVCLHVNDMEILVSEPVDAHEILRAWVEGEATWTDFSGAGAWTTAGAEGVGSDRGSAVIGSFDLIPDPPKSVSFDLDLTVVQSWVSSPGSNHGLRLSLRNEDPINLGSMRTGDWSTPEERPKVAINYYIPTATATPTITDTPTTTNTPTATGSPTITSTPSITPTPSETPVPALCSTDEYSYSLVLSSNNCVRVVRQITFGEIVTGSALLLLFALGAFYFTYKVITRWITI